MRIDYFLSNCCLGYSYYIVINTTVGRSPSNVGKEKPKVIG